MAKGDVTMKFDADTAQFVQSMMKAREVLEQTADKGRKVGEVMAKAGDGMSKMGEIGSKNLDAMKDAALGLVGGLNFVSIGISAITAAYDRQMEKMKRDHEANTRLNNMAAGQAAGSGNFGGGPALRSFYENIASNKMPLDKIFGLHEETRKRMPGKSDDEVKQIVASAVQAEKTGLNPSTVSGSMANLSRVYGKLSPEQLRDKAMKYGELTGGREFDDNAMNSLLRHGSMGGDVDEGFGIVAALVQSGKGPQEFGSHVDKVAEMKPRGKRDGKKHRLSKEDQAWNAVADLPYAERMKVINRGDGPDELKSELKAAMAFDPEKLSSELKNSGGTFDRAWKQNVLGDPKVVKQMALEAQQAKDKKEKEQQANMPGESTEQKWQMIEAYFDSLGTGGFTKTRLMTNMKLENFSRGLMQKNPNPEDLMPADNAVDYQMFKQRMFDEQQQTGAFSPGAQQAANTKTGETEQVRLLAQIAASILEVSNHMANQNTILQTPGGTALKSNNPGQE